MLDKSIQTFIEKQSRLTIDQINITKNFPKIESTDSSSKNLIKPETKTGGMNPCELKFQLQESLEKTSELTFEKETSIPDFDREPVYDVDNFEKNSIKVEKLLTPPPDFQDALKQLPQHLQEEFKHVLNANIVGIWPIKESVLLNKNSIKI